jgi:hypothetical protein
MAEDNVQWWVLVSAVLNFRVLLPDSNTRVYPKVSGLATWSENCTWYSSLPLGAVVSLFCASA